jgi:hypothetical protein
MRADVSARHSWVNAHVLTVGGLGTPKRVDLPLVLF